MNYIDCHEEPIHIPGHIQNYGYLIGLDAVTKTIEFYSSNLDEIFSFDEELFGWKIEDFADVFHAILDSPTYYQFNARTNKLKNNFGKIELKNGEYYFTIFRYLDFIYLEFEKKIIGNINQDIIYKSIKNINTVENADQIWQELTEQISKVTDFDRIMVYQFLSDGSGKVIAEKKLESMPTYLHLYYPESDIPRQARALYLKNHQRIFSNVYSAPITIISKNPIDIDLTYSNIRAMSPIHAQYLKNTNVGSSFSTSIIVDNELWGLVTCHSTKPKHIDLYNRIQSEIFTTMSANLYMSFQSRNALEYLTEFEKDSKKLKSKFLKFDSLKDSLFENADSMRKLLNCDGLVIIKDEDIKSVGNVPNTDIILRIKNWYLTNCEETFYQSNEFLKTHKEELDLDENAAGIMILSFPEFENLTIICFRKEFKEHINWAGIQEKNIEPTRFYDDEKLMVSPRKSFEIFSEQVKGKSRIWSKNNLKTVNRIREIILETSVIQFAKIQEHNKELLQTITEKTLNKIAEPLSIIKEKAKMISESVDNKDFISKNIIDEIDEISKVLSEITQLKDKNS